VAAARGCALIVAGVAAYGSYEHQRDFARHGAGYGKPGHGAG